MGDFSLIDPWQTFDTYEFIEDGSIEYTFPMRVVMFTWVIWGISIVFLFMIFMNFIIAVIGDTYDRVIQYKEAHDYQQRLMMLYEREVQFSLNDFDNETYFPPVLIARKLKENVDVK
jgi:hypothetical protein